jgi:hypothetical protein
MTRPSAVERPATCRGRWGTSSCAVQYGDRYSPGAIRSCGLRFSFAAESRIPATEGPRARYDSSCRELAALNEQDSTPYVPKTDRKLAAKPSIVTRVKEIQAENEAECRWGRKQLLDFYRDCFERGAGTLTADDRLCQGVEETTVRGRLSARSRMAD